CRFGPARCGKLDPALRYQTFAHFRSRRVIPAVEPIPDPRASRRGQGRQGVRIAVQASLPEAVAQNGELAALNSLILRCLRKDRAWRVQSTADLKSAPGVV